MKQDLFEKFIGIYNQIDAHMRKQLGVEKYTEHSQLIRRMAEKDKIFAQYLNELLTFADLRNVLDHNPYRSQAHPMAQPHEYIVKRYEQIKNLLFDPPKALSIAIPGSVIYTTSLSATAIDVMKVMNDKLYTHVPIMENDKMIGVFSENVILYYLVKNKDSIITSDTKIKEFADLVPLSKNRTEVFLFVPRGALLTGVSNIFNEGLRNGKRIAVVYITETGKQDEKVLGMITPWDLPGTTQ
ncbi:MAG: CBS domain-containing protein [Patescibacteria group bacterium]